MFCSVVLDNIWVGLCWDCVCWVGTVCFVFELNTSTSTGHLAGCSMQCPSADLALGPEHQYPDYTLWWTGPSVFLPLASSKPSACDPVSTRCVLRNPICAALSPACLWMSEKGNKCSAKKVRCAILFTGVAVSHCITWFQTQQILTPCQTRYHAIVGSS